jgi:hypothetical protein
MNNKHELQVFRYTTRLLSVFDYQTNVLLLLLPKFSSWGFEELNRSIFEILYFGREFARSKDSLELLCYISIPKFS